MNNFRNAAEWNHLGILYFSEQNWKEAIHAFQAAIALQTDFIDAYYNLGLVYNKLQEAELALQTYQTLIKHMPEHAPGRFQLASLYMRLGSYEFAIQHFLIILNEHFFHFETLANLATCYLQMGKLDTALCYYWEALQLHPQDKQILFNLGVINMQQGKTQQAIEYYLQVVRQPNDKNKLTEEILSLHYAAHNNLAVIYLSRKNKAAALLHFRELLKIYPYQESVAHTIKLLEDNKAITTIPLAYVKSLFNFYAAHYEIHLTQTLQYQVPQLMFEMIQAHAQPKGTWDILDLGCGTGLCGALFQAYARHLIGVDIANEMLKVAANKHIYNQLIEADILSFLNHSQSKYDLIVMGDVLPYFGNLSSITPSIDEHLQAGSFCIFSLEIGQHDLYEMTTAGRFQHPIQYIRDLIQQRNWYILQEKEVILRYQENQPVHGVLYLIKKK